jgi:hypothetical protein
LDSALEHRPHTFTVKSTTVAKRYIDYGHILHIHFFAGIYRTSRKGNYFCLTFQKALTNNDIVGNEVASENAAETVQGSGEQQAMLVDVRQLIEHPERVAGVILPSMVRLTALNDCLCAWINPSKNPINLRGVISSIPEDRELRILRDLVGEWNAQVGIMIDGEGIRHMVEGTTQIVENISDQHGKRIDWNSLDNGVLDEISRSVRVFLTRQDLKAVFEPSLFFDCQIVQVTLRPPKLELEVASTRHNEVESGYAKEAENKKRCGNSHPEAGRLLQESEESRHAFNVPPSEEVTSRTEPSHQCGDCTATHTRSNNPEGAS